MTRTNGCRECECCVGNSHHWLADPHDPEDLDDEDRLLEGDYGCKHCEQRGDECTECGGDGSPTGSEHDLCKTCRGEGVIPIGGTETDGN